MALCAAIEKTSNKQKRQRTANTNVLQEAFKEA